jgi:tRNA pseudouridine55 synthase
MDGTKRYRFTIAWGEATDTDDSEGNVIEVSPVHPTETDIRAILDEFVGTIEQTPPAYSAVKIDGKRAYALARAGQQVEIKSRQVRIDACIYLASPDPGHAEFEITCGKGTYVRSLARDISRRLGTVGHISSLRRTAAGPFDESGAISLESLESLVHSAPASAYLLAVETALDDIPALFLNAAQADHLRHGRAVRVQGPEGHTFVDTGRVADGDVFCAMAGGQPVALARLECGEIRPVRVLNL